MPQKYKRKEGIKTRQRLWTTTQLEWAFIELDKKEIGIAEKSRKFGIPPRTLRRRYATRTTSKLPLGLYTNYEFFIKFDFSGETYSVIFLGKHPILGFEIEKRIVQHIIDLGKFGFPPDRRSIRLLAYQYAEKFKIKHNFNHKNQMAGSGWFKIFMEKNQELWIRRQAEELSISRAKGMKRNK